MKIHFSSEENAAVGTKYVTSDTGGGGPASRSRWDPATLICSHQTQAAWVYMD